MRSLATGPSTYCPNLFQVLGAYLHQDWDLEYGDAEAALVAAITGQGREQVAAAADELRTHRPPRDDESASCRFTNGLCSYHPPGDGLSYSAWLDHVQHMLDRSVGA
jgi:hypothetical protein